MQPSNLRHEATVAVVAGLKPEVIIAVAYGQILRAQLLAIPPHGVLNIHPSLLPRYRGATPIPAAIFAGDEKTGVSIILMDEGMDSGPILAQRPYPISPEDTAESLSEKLSHVSADLLSDTLPAWLNGKITPQPQDAGGATTTRLLRKEDGEIDWRLPAADIWRGVRAYNPWPGAYTHLHRDLLHIWRAWPLDHDTAHPPGTVVELTEEQSSPVPGDPRAAFAVQTGRGVLAIRELQREGRKRLPAEEFLRGMPNVVGRQLGASAG